MAEPSNTTGAEPISGEFDSLRLSNANGLWFSAGTCWPVFARVDYRKFLHMF